MGRTGAQRGGDCCDQRGRRTCRLPTGQGAAYFGSDYNAHRGMGLVLRFPGSRIWRGDGVPPRRGSSPYAQWTGRQPWRLSTCQPDARARACHSERLKCRSRFVLVLSLDLCPVAELAGTLDRRTSACSSILFECDIFVLMKSSRIGFVGVGRMGANMARRLHEIGYPVVAIYDANAEIAAKLAQELGSNAVGKVSEVSRLCEVIFTVVTDDAAMRAIFLGPDNLFAEAKGKLFVNCATISPGVHVEIEKKGAELGAEVLEAPMASSLTHAREGKLYMMVGRKRGELPKS